MMNEEDDPMAGLEVGAKVDVWRQKMLAGTLTFEEQQAAVQAIRAGRIAAASQGAKTRAAKGPAKTAEQMLGELDAL